MSLIEDLSNPLSRLIVYLCLSLIGLKRELSPWSIQRREKSNHFSLCLSIFVYLFLPSSFCCSPSPSYCLCLCLSLSFSLFLRFTSNLHVFILSALLSSLFYFSSPSSSFSSSVLSLSSSPIFFSPAPWIFLYFFWASSCLCLLCTSDQLRQAIHQVRNS